MTLWRQPGAAGSGLVDHPRADKQGGQRGVCRWPRCRMRIVHCVAPHLMQTHCPFCFIK